MAKINRQPCQDHDRYLIRHLALNPAGRFTASYASGGQGIKTDDTPVHTGNKSPGSPRCLIRKGLSFQPLVEYRNAAVKAIKAVPCIYRLRRGYYSQGALVAKSFFIAPETGAFNAASKASNSASFKKKSR